MSNLIYTSSNIGFGHVTRDIAICSILKKWNIEPLFITARPLNKFINSYGFKFMEYSGEPSPITFRGKIVAISLWYIRYWLRYRKSFKWFKKIYDNLTPKLVISDEDFIALGVAQRLKIPTILITDQLEVAFAKTKVAKFFERRVQEWMQNRIMSALKVIVPSYKSNNENFGENIVYTGPIVRSIMRSKDDIRRELNVSDYEKLIIITGGGSNLGRHIILKIIKEVSLLKGDYKFFVVSKLNSNVKLDNRFIVKDFVRDLHEYIASADLVITLAGKSTIDEALVYGTPIIAIPIKNHFEQERNAARLGFSYEDIHNIRNLAETLIGKRRTPLATNGAEKAAKEIMNIFNSL